VTKLSSRHFPAVEHSAIERYVSDASDSFAGNALKLTLSTDHSLSMITVLNY